MILVANDINRRDIDSRELQSLIQRQGVSCDRSSLDFADACFEGQGPDGLVLVGIERKRLSDILKCIDDGRLAGHQLVGMRPMYRFRFLLIEGVWRPSKDGLLLEEHVKQDGRVYWGPERPQGRVMYHKLRRYLFSVAMSGVIVIYTRDITHTAYDIVELYHWFQKRWRDHKSMLEMHRGYAWQYQTRHTDELMMIPTMERKPPLVRRWAAELNGIGVKLSEDAQRVFKTPRELADADESDWMNVPGVGMKMAKEIVGEILGRRT